MHYKEAEAGETATEEEAKMKTRIRVKQYKKLEAAAVATGEAGFKTDDPKAAVEQIAFRMTRRTLVLKSGVKLIVEKDEEINRSAYYIAFDKTTVKAAFELMQIAGVGLEGGYNIGSMV